MTLANNRSRWARMRCGAFIRELEISKYSTPSICHNDGMLSTSLTLDGHRPKISIMHRAYTYLSVNLNPPCCCLAPNVLPCYQRQDQ